MIFVRRRASTKVRSSRFVLRVRLAMLQREAQMRDELVDVVTDRLHGGVGAPVLAGEREYPGLRVARRGSVVEHGPVARLDLAMQPFGQAWT
jgi:hypothetical protein